MNHQFVRLYIRRPMWQVLTYNLGVLAMWLAVVVASHILAASWILEAVLAVYVLLASAALVRIVFGEQDYLMTREQLRHYVEDDAEWR